MQRTVLRVTPLAEQGVAPLVPPLIDALDREYCFLSLIGVVELYSAYDKTSVAGVVGLGS